MSFNIKKWLLENLVYKKPKHRQLFRIDSNFQNYVFCCLLQHYVFKGKQEVDKLYGIFSLTLTKTTKKLYFFICLGSLENYRLYKTALNMCVVQSAKTSADHEMTIF